MGLLFEGVKLKLYLVHVSRTDDEDPKRTSRPQGGVAVCFENMENEG